LVYIIGAVVVFAVGLTVFFFFTDVVLCKAWVVDFGFIASGRGLGSGGGGTGSGFLSLPVDAVVLSVGEALFGVSLCFLNGFQVFTFATTSFNDLGFGCGGGGGGLRASSWADAPKEKHSSIKPVANINRYPEIGNDLSFLHCDMAMIS
jgi:hypothetical protein